MQIVEAVVVVTEAHPRDKRVMTRRDMWIFGTVIVLIAVGYGIFRAVTGAGTRTAVLSALYVAVATGLALTLNQVLARRRARRRTTA
ncbi:hypothetical protein [Cellulomonas sp.]|uniref:hypothetical protein n=1 Tax=Cellulomonas sp. TaxID=40001 RepID=UPI001B1BC8C7|nr:hypothetical protein [Cellulomonas sp.]MBO9554499.1 hypothetical protein [Cellulomonas sp.]